MIKVFAVLLISLKLICTANASDQIKVIRPFINNPNRYINSLKIDENPPDLIIDASPEIYQEPTLKTTIRGIYGKKDSNLLVDNVPIHLGEHGSFQIKIRLIQPTTVIRLTEIQANGSILQEPVQIHLGGYNRIIQENTLYSKSKIRFSLGLGPTAIFYTQPLVSTYTETTLTGKLGTSYAFSQSRWSLGLNAFSTFFKLTSSSSDPRVQSESLNFLGINFRVGYMLPWVNSPWTLQIWAGLYYTTTFGSEILGYQNFGGPQLFPTLTRTLKDQSRISAYLKFSPISSGLSLLTISSNEIGIGSSYSFAPQKNNNFWSINLDAAAITIQTTLGTLKSYSTSLSLGYSL